MTSTVNVKQKQMKYEREPILKCE